ncbi:tetratricopeptide repeat protein [Rheinheimera sp.]|uniref:tetratricopeptide repeat protein n=1 Tax=Rheinheimera sp. TaxID=1869214 RepID=UPI003D2B9399
MSVINQMLRDLDKRQARPATLAGPALQHTSSSRRWLWWLLLLPVLWIGAQWLSNSKPDLTPAAEQPSVTQTAVPATTQAAVLPNTPAAAVVKTAAPEVPPTIPQQTAASSAPASAMLAVPAQSKVESLTPAQPTTELPPADAQQQGEQITASEVAVPAETESEPNNADAFALSAETAAFLQDADNPAAAQATTPPVEKAQMSVTRTDPSQAGPQHLRALAMQAQAAGRFAEAETAWLQLIRQQPQQTESYEALAQLYLQQQQPQRLVSLLQQAQQQQLQSPALQWAQIQLLASTAQWQALLGALTPELQQQYPQQALALEAHAAQQLGQTERALQVYQRWTERAPQDSRAWLGLATLLDQSGQWPQAKQAYQHALQLGGLADASRQFIQQRLQQDTQS